MNEFIIGLISILAFCLVVYVLSCKNNVIRIEHDLILVRREIEKLIKHQIKLLNATADLAIENNVLAENKIPDMTKINWTSLDEVCINNEQIVSASKSLIQKLESDEKERNAQYAVLCKIGNEQYLKNIEDIKIRYNQQVFEHNSLVEKYPYKRLFKDKSMIEYFSVK